MDNIFVGNKKKQVCCFYLTNKYVEYVEKLGIFEWIYHRYGEPDTKKQLQ